MNGKKARKMRQAIALHIDADRFCKEERQYGWTPMYKDQENRLYWTIKKPSDKEIAEQFSIGNRLYKLVPLRLMNVPGRLTYKQLKKQVKLENKAA
jgi:hypothetical protein